MRRERRREEGINAGRGGNRNAHLGFWDGFVEVGVECWVLGDVWVRSEEDNAVPSAEFDSGVL
jgi:hypothetical protein